MRQTLRSRYRRAAGQGLVEFALVFPVIVMMLFGLIDGGRLVYSYSTLTNAARTGIRLAIVNQNATGIDNAIASNAVTLGLTGANVDYKGYKNSDDPLLATDPQAAGDCVTVEPGCIAVVTVHYDFVPYTPLVSNLGPVLLTTTAQMPVERAFTNP